ncbi:glycosyltransferase [Desulfosediminicola sp.]|uniref:glycosyltransferase n=1 Tax=Desulfosediminicola sp. TaxID=2886825 RepID=UPI003AF20C04
MSLKILHVCFSDSFEGGAIGAFRLHRTMVDNNINSYLLVYRKNTNDPRVIRLPIFNRLLIYLYSYLTKWILKLDKSPDVGFRSLNIFPTGTHKQINKLKPDIVQLHWINNNTISIAEISKIHAPVVWKLPDMWAFSGVSHYVLPDQINRYTYHNNKIPANPNQHGLDLEKYVMLHKKRCWSNKTLTIVTPSKWLAKCAKESVLFNNYRIKNIANPINFNHFKSIKRKEARNLFSLPLNKKLILFSGINSTHDKRKGFSYLIDALKLIQSKENKHDIELLVMGSYGPKKHSIAGYPVNFLGRLRDNVSICAGYNSADILVLPTLADNLPNVVKEAMACGIPCVGFNIGGMPDMITHKRTGYLAEPFSSEDLAKGILWTLNQDQVNMSKQVRSDALRIHSPKKRCTDYIQLYNEISKAP